MRTNRVAAIAAVAALLPALAACGPASTEPSSHHTTVVHDHHTTVVHPKVTRKSTTRRPARRR